MAIDHDQWVGRTLELLTEEQSEQRRLEQRLEAARRALSEVTERIAAIQATIDVYRARHGLTISIPKPETPEPLGEYRDLNLNYKGMISKWADEHNGIVVMRELANALTSAGVFKENTQAAGALYPAMKRLPGFQKVSRGVYQNHVTIDDAELVKHNGQYEPTEQAGTSEGSRLFGRGQLNPQHSSDHGSRQEYSPETSSGSWNSMRGVPESDPAQPPMQADRV